MVLREAAVTSTSKSWAMPLTVHIPVSIPPLTLYLHLIVTMELKSSAGKVVLSLGIQRKNG